MKNNKLSIFTFFAFAIAIFASSCSDQFTEEDAIRLQSYIDKEVQFSISVVDAAKVTLLKSANISRLDTAVVSIAVTQGNAPVTQIADENGMAVFSNLREGTVSVSIKCDGYAKVNFVADLTGKGQGFASALIPMIPVSGNTTATIKGNITYDSNLTNKAKEIVPSGTKVMALISTEGESVFSYNKNNEIISTMAYGDLNLEAATDAEGNYTITVPATTDGLSFELFVPEFQVDQSVYMQTVNYIETTGVQAIPASFGSVFNNYEDISSIPGINPVSAILSPPNATTEAPKVLVDVTNDGKIIRVTSENSDDISKSNPIGSGYLTIPTIQFISFANGVGSGAIAQVIIDEVSQQITAINVLAGGSGYTAYNFPYSEIPADDITVTVRGTSTSVRNIYLGTGKRTIEE